MPASVEFIEKILAQPNTFGTYQNITRILRFLKNRFNFNLEITLEESKDDEFEIIKPSLLESYNYEEHSEEYLEKEIPRLQEERRAGRE